nr:reverse transcriptase domain-containing protein [Tanacetum cinerariifolium]
MGERVGRGGRGRGPRGVEAGHAAYTDRFHKLARLVPHLVTPESRKIERYVYGLAPQIYKMVATRKPNTMQKATQISGALTDEAVRNGLINKVEKRGNMGEPRKDKNGRDDNKRAKTRNGFCYNRKPYKKREYGKIERYVYGLAPQIYKMVAATKPNTMQKATQISGALTDEAVRNGLINKVEKRGNIGEPRKDKNGRDDNKRAKTRNAFATTANPIGRESTGIRRALLMLEILSRRFFFKLNLSDHREHQRGVEIPVSS